MSPKELLSDIVSLWSGIATRAAHAKFKQFGKTADRAWAFRGKDYKSLYIDARDANGEKYPYVETGIWRARRNLARDYETTMLPYIHAKIPSRLVLPRRPGIPPELLAASAQNPELAQLLMQADAAAKARQPVDSLVAYMLKWWLNYLVGEWDLFGEQRRALPEALLKGRCVCWTEVDQGPNGLIPRTSYDTVDGLLCDPDSRHWRDQGFIIRQRLEDASETAKKFRLPLSVVKGKGDNNNPQGGGAHEPWQGANLRPEAGKTSPDVAFYYEVFSRRGFGQNFDKASVKMKNMPALSELGDNIYLAIMPGVPYPLNLPPDVLETADAAEIRRRVAWPLPFHRYMPDPWSATVCDFLPNQNDPWASSPLEGSLPLLAFIDHSYCYLMQRVKHGCRSVFIGSKALEDEFVAKYLGALDLEYIPYDGEPGTDLSKLLQRVDFPMVRKDVLLIVEKMEKAFEESSGMMGTMRGQTPMVADRSAAATSAREGRLQSRPNDFADCAEAWNSRIAAKEALATRLYVGPETIAPFFGEAIQQVPDPSVPPELAQSGQEVPTVPWYGPLTTYWMQNVLVAKTPDGGEMDTPQLEEAAAAAGAEFTVTVEAGSGRRKNVQKEGEDFKNLMQTFGPIITQMLTAGNPAPYNAMVSLASEVFDRNLDSFMIHPQPPGQQPGGEPQQPPNEPPQGGPTQ
jgi:hypothetical protein